MGPWKVYLNCFFLFRDQFNIKWVDDTHALAVFSTPFAATEALSAQIPLMKLRHISEASKQSKLKVKRCTEFLLPFKPRPQTSASVARRMVSGALGLRVQVAPEQRKRELQMMREAKGQRRTAAKQRVDVWNGEVLWSLEWTLPAWINVHKNILILRISQGGVQGSLSKWRWQLFFCLVNCAPY